MAAYKNTIITSLVLITYTAVLNYSTCSKQYHMVPAVSGPTEYRGADPRDASSHSQTVVPLL